MTKATVRVKNTKGQLIFSKTWETKDPVAAAKKFGEMYPECWVNVNTENNSHYIANMPVNMKRDETLVDSGQMSITRFMSKWYGKALPKESIEKELVEEFGEEDLV